MKGRKVTVDEDLLIGLLDQLLQARRLLREASRRIHLTCNCPACRAGPPCSMGKQFAAFSDGTRNKAP
jgi:hypothetical protein